MLRNGLTSLVWSSALLLDSVATALPSEQKILDVSISDNAQHIRHELKKAEIIPTVIDDFLPTYFLEAQWSSSNEASLGNTIKPKKLQDAPTIKLSHPKDESACRSSTTYIVTLSDPDAPSRDDPKWSEMCHWIATGVSKPSDSGVSCSDSEIALASLHDLIEYKPPGPPPKTGKHRYAFLVFAPANGTTEKLHLSKPKDRKHWGTDKERHGVRDWSTDNGLVPVAANFIYAQNKKQ